MTAIACRAKLQAVEVKWNGCMAVSCSEGMKCCAQKRNSGNDKWNALCAQEAARVCSCSSSSWVVRGHYPAPMSGEGRRTARRRWCCSNRRNTDKLLHRKRITQGRRGAKGDDFQRWWGTQGGAERAMQVLLGGVALVVHTTGDQLAGARSRADELQVLRLDQRRGNGRTDGQRKPQQHQACDGMGLEPGRQGLHGADYCSIKRSARSGWRASA